MNENQKVLWISNMFPSSKSPTYGIFIKEQFEIIRKISDFNFDIVSINSSEKHLINKIKNYSFLFFNVLKKIRNKFDLIHVHYVFPTMIYAIPFKLINKSKLVVTVHGGDWQNKIKGNKGYRFLFGYFEKYIDHLIVVSPYLKSEILKQYPNFEKRISVIDMGIDLSKFTKKNIDYKLYNEVIFIGNFIFEKGVLDIIEAIKYLNEQKESNYRFRFLIGKKNENLFQKTQYFCESNEINNVSFEGPYSKEKINEVLSTSFCTVIPSHHEGFGIVALEAMVSRSPIIYSSTGGLKELCKGIGIAIEPKSPKELAQAIKRLSIMNKDSEVLNLNIAENRARSYDMTIKANQVNSIYNNLLSERH